MNCRRYSRLLSAALVQAKAGEREDPSNNQDECADDGPERLAGHEAAGLDTHTLQYPDAAHKDH